MPTKTYPQLDAQTSVLAGDLIASWRSIGPLKTITAAILKAWVNEGVVTDITTLGVSATSLADQTAVINAAIATGAALLWPAGTYYAHSLNQTTARQWMIGLGRVEIVKNGNGDLFTSSGANVTLTDMQFRGDAATPTYTGHNVVSTGNDFSMINCGSRWAYARAVKATGSHVQIIGTCDIYQTADGAGVPASAYDIEVGLSGTARLYCVIQGILTTQNSGGILATDTGSLSIIASQFGKLTIASGTGPAGSNGGITTGCRILGDVSVGIPGAVLNGNQFGAVDITFESGTSGCSLDASNVLETGATVTNNGNGSNFIERNVGTSGFPIVRYGADASYVDVEYILGDKTRFTNGIRIPNNITLLFQNAAGAGGSTVYVDVGGDLNVINSEADRGVTISTTGASSYFEADINGSTPLRVNAIRAGVRMALAPGSTSYTNDAAAAVGGVAVGEVYRNGSVLQVRVS